VDAPTCEIYDLFPSRVQSVIVVNNLRPGGAIRGISGTLRRKVRGECCAYSKVIYVVAPAEHD
jgi:hypothetical protein